MVRWKLPVAGLLITSLLAGLLSLGAGPGNGKGPPPDEVELLVFIHYPKGKGPPESVRPGGGKGGGSCPSTSIGKWPTTAVSFVVNSVAPVTDAAGVPVLPADVEAAVAASFTAWSDASGLAAPSIGAFAGLPSTYLTGTRNGVNEIAWATLGDPDAIAVTWVWRTRAGKQIVEADMVNNTDPGFGWVLHSVTGDPDTAAVPATGKYDVQDIDTHEMGHLVGMGHVQEAAHTMYTYGAPDEVKKRSLECGDVAGIQKLYGQ